jgi:hypothetical protein
MPRVGLATAVTLVLLCLSAVFGLLYLEAPSLASRFDFLAIPRPPAEIVRASTAVDAVDSQDIITPEEEIPPGTKMAVNPDPRVFDRGRHRHQTVTTTTQIDFSYVTPVDVNDTADIKVILDQYTVVRPYSPGEFDTGRLPESSHVTQLDSDVVLRLAACRT